MIIISQDKKTAFNLNELLCVSRDKKRITATVPVFLEDRMPRIRLATYESEEEACAEFERLTMAMQDGKEVYTLHGGSKHGRTDNA